MKKIKKEPLHFKDEIYNTTIGSFLVCECIYGNITMPEVRSKWEKFKRGLKAGKFDELDLYNPEVLEKIFDIKHEPIDIVFVVSRWNALFMPIQDKQVLPLREDGAYPQTFLHAEDIRKVAW